MGARGHRNPACDHSEINGHLGSFSEVRNLSTFTIVKWLEIPHELISFITGLVLPAPPGLPETLNSLHEEMEIVLKIRTGIPSLCEDAHRVY